MSYPLGKKGPVIGTPHVGTHTLGNWQSDNAYDIGVPVGTPVYAIGDGTIGSNIGSLGAAAGSRFAGLRVQLDGPGNSWWYGHLSRLVVHAGQKVKAGDLLGYSGSANGVAHLHVSQMHGDPHAILEGQAVGGQPQLTTGTGGVGEVVSQAAQDASDIPGKIVSAFGDALGQEGARILLWVVLVGGGTVLAVLGITRLSGLKPARAVEKVAKTAAVVAR